MQLFYGKTTYVKNVREYAVLVLLCTSAAMLSGCEAKVEMVPISGKVTFEGKPLPTGTIMFVPVDGGKAAIGGIKPDGTYIVSTKKLGDGVKPGDYKVTIDAVEVKVDGKAAADQPVVDDREYNANARVSSKQLIPPEYGAADTTPISQIVTSETKEVNFELPLAK